MGVQTDQTTQGRVDDLTSHSAAMSLNPQTTVAELLTALQQQNPYLVL